MSKVEDAEIREIMTDLPGDTKEEQRKEEVALDVNNSIQDQEMEEKIHMQMRLGFIRKVYGILSVQLLITFLLCGMTFFQSVKVFMLENLAFFWIAAALSLILVIPLLCFKSVARRVPLNYIVLMLWTMCEAYIVACCCAIYNPTVVIMAAFATLAITVSITIYALTTKEDFTFGGGMLFSAACGLLLLTLFSFIFPFLHALICVFGVLLYSMYLLYDTQLIFGKVGLEYDVDDYILASLNIYLDIIQIFLYLLELFGRLSNN
jgi:FtsH-binding integral membrane protein